MQPFASVSADAATRPCGEGRAMLRIASPSPCDEAHNKLTIRDPNIASVEAIS